MARKTTNSRAFALLGLTQEDFERWCEENKKSKSDRASKKEFFKLALRYDIIKRKDKEESGDAES